MFAIDEFIIAVFLVMDTYLTDAVTAMPSAPLSRRCAQAE